LLHGHLRCGDGARLTVSHLSGPELLEAVSQNQLDAGILEAPRVPPPGCRITHRMADHFVLIAPVDFAWPAAVGKRWTKDLRERLDQASWLMLAPGMQTRQDLDTWMRKAALAPERIAVFDSFDLIIHLVALGLGIALVPRRALAPFPRKKQLKLCTLPEAFERQLVVVTRARGAVSGHVKAFVENILFS
jgi:DNA-binding transcriptional LysR family regulator